MLAIIIFLIEIVEYVLQSLACKEDAAFNRTQRDVHLIGYLLVFIACNKHRERNAVFLAERIDDRGDFLYIVCHLRRIVT